jgi:RNA polymerase sigma-70 factor (ECF subfamily)
VKADSGTHGGFEQMAMPLFDSLYNFARWLAHDEAEAEDLVQETFTKALRGFSSFSPGTDFRAWMFRILRNTFLTSRTGLRARMTVPLEAEDEEAIAVTWETPESLAIASATREVLQEALGRLPVAYREVVLLCDVESMRYREIAEVLSIPVGTVMSRLARARKLLRQMLSGERVQTASEGGEQKR